MMKYMYMLCTMFDRICAVSESLAAFVAAEQLSTNQRSVSDAEMEQAMLDAQTRQAAVNAAINARSNGKGASFSSS